jgi:hypothetical protein
MCRQWRGAAVVVARCVGGAGAGVNAVVCVRAGGRRRWRRARCAGAGGGTTGVGRRGWRRNKRRRDGRRSAAAARKVCGCDDGRRGNAAGGGGGVAQRRWGRKRRRRGVDYDAVASGGESHMTCGPRRISYRRLIRRLGFEHRLISSVWFTRNSAKSASVRRLNR